MKAFLEYLICGHCGVQLLVRCHNTLIHPDPINDTRRAEVKCPHRGRYYMCPSFELETPATRDTTAPPPPGPSIRPPTPTPPLAPTPSPAGGSNEDMGQTDAGHKKEKSKPGPGNPAQILQKEIVESEFSMEECGRRLRAELGREGVVKEWNSRWVCGLSGDGAAFGWVELGRGDTRREAVLRALGLKRRLQYAIRGAEEATGRLKEKVAKAEAAFADELRPSSEGPERVAGLEEVVPREPRKVSEYEEFEAARDSFCAVNPDAVAAATKALAEKMGMKEVPLGKPREKVADTDVEYWRKRGLDAESDVAAIRKKGIEIANESRRMREALNTATERVSWLTESNETLQKIAEDRFQKWQSAEKWGKECKELAHKNYESACDVTREFNEVRGKLQAAEKQIEIMRGYAERADLKITCLEAQAEKSTRRPEPPREKVRQVESLVMKESVAQAVMKDRFGQGGCVFAGRDGFMMYAKIDRAIWGEGLTFGEAVADAINRWNRGEEAYT